MAKRGMVLMLLIALLLLSSCSRDQSQQGSVGQSRVGNAPGDPIKIGFSIATDTFIIERWNKDIKIFTEVAKSRGAEVIMQLSAGGTQAQIEQIEYLLGRDIDVLVVLAHDTELLSGVIGSVMDKGIPVICYDRLIQGVAVDAYVSFDNHKVGTLFGDALLNAVPSGNYLIVNGSVKDDNSYKVNEGLHSVLDRSISSGMIQVVDEIWLEEWSSDEATEKIRKVLSRTTDIDAISAGNDQLANAAISLLAELRMAGEVAVVGQDADLLSCQRIIEGLQLMSVYKPIAKLAEKAAHLAITLAKGEALPEPDSFTDNGSSTPIPFYMEDPVAVFRDNMEQTVIRDGFHSYADVYRENSPD